MHILQLLGLRHQSLNSLRNRDAFSRSFKNPLFGEYIVLLVATYSLCSPSSSFTLVAYIAFPKKIQLLLMVETALSPFS
jgi:hypothetical protein